MNANPEADREVGSPSEPRRTRGRPKKRVTKDMIAEGFQLAKKGRTDRQIASALGVSERTLNRWKADPDFMSALREGKNEADEQVLWGLYARAVGFSYWEITEELVRDGRVHSAEGAGKAADTSAGMKMAITKRVRKVVAPDSVAALWWLRNRRPTEWRDRRNDDGPFAGRVVVKELEGMGVCELAQLAEILKEMAKNLKE